MFFSCFFWCFEIFLASLGKYVCMSVVHLGCTHFKEVMKKHCGRCLWVIKYDGYEDVCRALQFIYIYTFFFLQGTQWFKWVSFNIGWST